MNTTILIYGIIFVLYNNIRLTDVRQFSSFSLLFKAFYSHEMIARTLNIIPTLNLNSNSDPKPNPNLKSNPNPDHKFKIGEA